MMRLVKASEIQKMDQLTIRDIGIPGVVLMENAARGASRVFLEHYEPPESAPVTILCGRGNNGGDGYVIARYLHQAGLKVSVIVLSNLDRISGDALINLDIIKRMDLDLFEFPGPETLKQVRDIIGKSEYIIDGILGTGLNSNVKGFYRDVIEEVNQSGRPVMAVDIPSGLNADTGKTMGVAVKADLTVTFGFPKLGQVLSPGADLVGRLIRIDIGIPEKVSDMLPVIFSMIEPADFDEILCPASRGIHKGDRGHLLIIAGSPGKTGAAALSALGALRAGAGLVTVGIPKSLNSIMEAKLTEAMTVPLPETESGGLSLRAKEEIFQLAQGKSALAIGPGLSTDPETTELVREIVKGCDLPMVIDADGLNALAEESQCLFSLDDRKILTPHPGEMGRLTGMKSGDVQFDRIGITGDFVRKYGCNLVLKGSRTLVSGTEGPVYLNSSGNPALASGGSGDVLTGLISGFLAAGTRNGAPLIKAVLAGVSVHGLAADLLAEEMGERGVFASELLDVIPGLLDMLGRKEWPLDQLPPFYDFYQPL